MLHNCQFPNCKDWAHKRINGYAVCLEHYRLVQRQLADARGARKVKHRLPNYIQHIQNKYGMSAEDYIRYMRLQRGHCPICQKRFIRGKDQKRRLKTELVVDHNHKTGEVRGLLCPTCNTLLGLAQDDPTLLQRAIEYLAGGLTTPWGEVILPMAANGRPSQPDGNDAASKPSPVGSAGLPPE